jgi:hypothetical protein
MRREQDYVGAFTATGAASDGIVTAMGGFDIEPSWTRIMRRMS